MTIGAAHITLFYLTLKCFEPVTGADYHGDAITLIASMVEIEDNDVVLAAVDARVFTKIFNHISLVDIAAFVAGLADLFLKER
jgi:hypothetical protein